MQLCCEEGSVGGLEPWPLLTELALQDADLVTQRGDLDVLLPVARRQPSNYGEGVGHGEIRETEQHDGDRLACVVPQASGLAPRRPFTALTCTDAVLGRDNVSPYARSAPHLDDGVLR